MSVVRSLRAALAVRRIPAVLGMWRDFRPFVRLHFLAAAFECGLLRSLRTPSTREELVQTLAVRRPELFDALLDLGVSLGELSLRDGRYSLCGGRSKLIASDAGDPFAALAQEWVRYDNAVFRDLPPRLQGGPLGDYLGPTATIVARSSRILEPFIAAFIRELVTRRRPRRLLDVGCGSGAYLIHAGLADGDLTGTGLDIQPAVVAQARANVSSRGLAERFDVIVADVRAPPSSTIRLPFDLITLINNVYYFAPDERPGLFARLRSWLTPGGALVVVAATRDGGATIRAFDLVLRSTEGCSPLPDRGALSQQLHASGFSEVRWERLALGQPLDAVVAT